MQEIMYIIIWAFLWVIITFILNKYLETKKINNSNKKADELIKNAHSEKDELLKKAKNESNSILDKARHESSEIIKKAEKH